jgi:transposase-like protein
VDLKCPRCQGEAIVNNTRRRDGAVRRYCQCKTCDKRFRVDKPITSTDLSRQWNMFLSDMQALIESYKL